MAKNLYRITLAKVKNCKDDLKREISWGNCQNLQSSSCGEVILPLLLHSVYLSSVGSLLLQQQNINLYFISKKYCFIDMFAIRNIDVSNIKK